MVGDDAAEGDLVTGSRRRHQIRVLPTSRPRHRPHTIDMHGSAYLSQEAATISDVRRRKSPLVITPLMGRYW